MIVSIQSTDVRRAACLLAAAGFLFGGASLLAQAPPPDAFAAHGAYSQVVFGSGEIPPIPQGFFSDDSLPYAGTVPLVAGVPLDEESGADTLIQRAADPNFQDTGFPSFAAPEEVVIVELSLNSENAIVVKYGDGHVEEWLVDVGLSIADQFPGTYFARLDSPTGGGFSATLPVLPALSFVKVTDIVAFLAGEIGSDEIAVRFLDFGEYGYPPIELSFSEFPFSTVDLDNNTGFFPGVLPGGEGTVVISSDEPFEPVQHVFEPPPPPPPKRCTYKHAASIPSVNPPCLPKCPLPLPPIKDKLCQNNTDCPVPFKIRMVRCRTQGRCLEVYPFLGCL